MKRLIWIVILVLAFAATSAANAEKLTITVENVMCDTSSEQVEIPVVISGNTGIAGMMLTLNYDDELTLVSIAKGTALSGLVFTKPGKMTSPCNLLWDGEEADTSNGTILKLTFNLPSQTTKASYDISISYKNGMIYDNDFENLYPIVVNGKITVNRTEEIVYGDTTGDGTVSVSDVIYTLQILASSDMSSLTAAQIIVADVNGNGVLDISDAIRMLQHIASPDISLNPSF